MALIFGKGNVMFLVILNGLGLSQGFLFSGVVVNVKEGEQAILKCTITVHIPTWTSPSGGFLNGHDFASLSPSSPFRNRMGIAANGDLIINNTRDYDRGDYLCSYPGFGKQTVRLIVADTLTTTTKSGTTLRPTDCCICDDTSPDLSKRCSVPNICDSSFTKCDYCETERKYAGAEWKITRRCGVKDSCTAKLYLTAAEPGCEVNGSPQPGISCYSCCLANDRRDPFFCVSNPDTNHVDFEITTASTVSPQIITRPVQTATSSSAVFSSSSSKVYSSTQSLVDIDDCNSHPCMNGGTCVDGLYKYTCLCAHLYNGTNCQNDLSSFGCAVDPCLNGGTCVTITGVKNYRCYCYNNVTDYNAFNVYCRELAPGTVSLTGYRAQGDDDKHCAYCTMN